ncbi:SERTA domain containing protein [Asbolus verrucosus]|uniref:SERTA domain containing protein n=1 Tax=Asbolus verrucosus TaxID=1661398 RepID=A0A482WAN7_ASBVE|nr:SERTA domain containing protein [Asbolus verrucosus]
MDCEYVTYKVGESVFQIDISYFAEAESVAATMKSPPAANDDCDDIFGPPRTYPSGYCPPKNRPSMISAKYRQKEERRKVLKISLNKLKKIEDPESSLCRSVLINNTMKRLQKEARDEKIQKQQLNYPRCYDNDNILNIKNEFIKNENKNSGNFEEPQVDFVVENDFDAKLAEEIVTAKNMEVFSELVEENLSTLEPTFASSNPNLVQEAMEAGDRFATRKRSFDDMEDCDVQDVLSQFYMPPTPRMLTCIDDDEDVNVGDASPGSKRLKVDDHEPKRDFSEPANMEDVCDKNGDFSVNNFINNNIPSESRLRFTTQNETDSNSYSCGHASMFNELQSNVYHNLIASLET